MREGIGSVVMIAIIVFFIVAASSFLAFNVNYTKAFRMKNKIISVYEEYEGDCTSSACITELRTYAYEIGYQPSHLECDEFGGGYVARPDDGNVLFCERKTVVNTNYSGSSSGIDANGVVGDKIGTHYYSVYTTININIPIFNNLFSPKFLYVFGDTRLF